MVIEQTAISFTYPTHSHRSDPATSHDAADRMERTGAAGRQAQEILGYFREVGPSGATSYEIGERFAVRAGVSVDEMYHRAGRRIADLVEAGRLVATDERRDGRMVWRVV